jgi:hypothetical protein
MRRALSIVFGVGGVICVLGLWFLKSDPRGGDAADGAARVGNSPIAVSGLAGTSTSTSLYVIHEDMGHLELVRRVAVPEVQLAREVLVEPPVRVAFGDAPTLRFALGDKGVVNPSASVFHGSDPVLQVPVLDEGDGVYDVAFTPIGPGQYNVVLNDGGLPVASKRVGVVGVAGDPGRNVDSNFLSVDPRQPRSRAGGKGRRR